MNPNVLKEKGRKGKAKVELVVVAEIRKSM